MVPGPDSVIDPFVVLAASLHFDRGAYAVMVGAGMSTSAGIPTGWDLTRELAGIEAQHQDGRVPDDVEAWWSASTRSCPFSPANIPIN